jgi:ribosome modulation factor
VEDHSELKAAKAAIRSRERMDRSTQQAFQHGQSAFLAEIPLDSCRLKTPSKRNAWERGWRDAERIRLEQEALKSTSASEKDQILSALGKLKDLLK